MEGDKLCPGCRTPYPAEPFASGKAGAGGNAKAGGNKALAAPARPPLPPLPPPQTVVVIMRGIPGAGKSTTVARLQSASVAAGRPFVVCSADKVARLPLDKKLDRARAYTFPY
jgi:hypothetical protein